MKVRATAPGYFEGFREVGAEFHVPEGREAPWWVAAEAFTPAAPEAPPESFSQINAEAVKVDKRRRRNLGVPDGL